jgi:hypothetical protein
MPTQNKLQVVYKEVDDLIPYARNSKIHDETNVNLIAGSIKSFGFNNPVLLDGENGIIAGHGRVLAAKKLGMKQIPTIELQGLSETEKRAYIIADNRLTEKSEWDKDMLGLELADLKALNIDLDSIGFNESEVEELLGAESEFPEIDDRDAPLTKTFTVNYDNAEDYEEVISKIEQFKEEGEGNNNAKALLRLCRSI